MAFSLSRNEHGYVKLESAYGTIPTFANTDAFRFVRAAMLNDVAVIQRPDKTGSRSQTAGTPGRKFARWTCEMGLSASGSVGVKPHVDPFLVALFGKAPTVNAGVSVVYSMDDAIPSLSLASYRSRSNNITDRILHGAVVTGATFNLGQDAATWAVEGTGQWVLESGQWANADATQKGGLSSFPAEPGAPDASDGGLTIGFTGSFTGPDGAMGNIRQSQIRVLTYNDTVRDTFGEFYPTETEGDERVVTLAFSVYDKDDTATEKLRQYANAKTPIDVTMVVGTVAGNIWSFALNQIQLAAANLNDNQRRWAMDFGESRAFATNISSLDELVLTLT